MKYKLSEESMETKLKKAQLLFIVLFCFILLLIPKRIYGAILYLSSESQTIYQGDFFIVEVRVDSEGERINTIGANLTFSSDLLRAVDFNKGGSIFALWVQEPNVLKGKISFMGGAPGGFQGDGLVTKITFLGEKLGEAKVSFGEDSQVLLHSPEAESVSVSLREGNYEIIEKPEELLVVTSESHPDPNKWYEETTLSLYWKPKEGAEYSWILSYDFEAEPDDTPNEPKPKEGLVWMGAMGYEDLEDGIYYFHLKEKLPGEDWSEKVTLRAMIDSTPPESFKPEIGQDYAMFEGKYFLGFVTVDKTSGVDHYEVAEVKRHSFLEELLQKEEKKEWKTAESPYLLEDQGLRSKISVKAIDKAGNVRIEEIAPFVKSLLYWIIILVLVGVVIITWITYKILKLIRSRK
jgi:hypothetical protein